MSRDVATGLVVLVLLGAVALPWWPESPESANRRLDERIDQLERTLDRVDDRARSGEAKAVSNEAVIDELARKVGRIEPANAVWIDLRPGGGNKWILPTGAEATVKFVSAGDDGGVTLRVTHKTLDSEFLMRAGEAVRAVDDRGTERRVYTTTLHTLERDRTGDLRRARVSVAYTVESGL